MKVEDLSVNVKTSVAVTIFVVSVCWGFYVWANDEHKNVETLAREQAQAVLEQQKQTDLLKQLVGQQAEILKKAAEDAQTNRETLIRIEAKLERD